MPIMASDIKIRLSTKSGSAGNTLAQSDVNSSLGKYISTTGFTNSSPNNLFSNVTAAENAGDAVDYRCIFVYNSHGTLNLENAGIYFDSQVAGGTTLAMAIDNIAASAIGSSSAQAFAATDSSTSPGGAAGAFSAPTTIDTGLSLGTIPSGFCKAVWIRRTAANTGAVDTDGGSFVIFGDTAE